MDSKNDGRTYEQGRENQARYTMERLARRGLRISFISKVTGYDEATIKKWCRELEDKENYEEGIRLGKLEVSKTVSRNLYKMGKSIKDISELIEEDIQTVTEWIAETEEK